MSANRKLELGPARAGKVDGMEPPEIRVSRYEHSVAIRWADDENWYRIEPDHMRYGTGTERFRVGPGAFDTPDAEWINPFDDPRPDIRRWTEPMRSELHSILRRLDSAEQHPWSG